MARDFGAFYYSAWNDGDFRALPDPAQALYFKLVTHPTLSWTGNGIRDGRTKTDGDRVEVLWSNRPLGEQTLDFGEGS